MRTAPTLLLAAIATWTPTAASLAAPEPPDATTRAEARSAVAAVLDDFHAAAAIADEERYFGHLAEDSVFLGTDATERWTKSEFLAFARPYFSQGRGWTFEPRDRHVDFAAGGTVAWFDELLDSVSYGECRGTGLLEKRADGWKILQYHLTIPVPNDLAKEIVARIREAAREPVPLERPE
jgi:ketosteroid isomerase-like protein